MRVPILAAAFWLGSAVGAQDGALRVQPDAKNHIPQALVGSWRLDVDLTKRLGQVKAPPTVTFRLDDKVVEKLPSDADAMLHGRRLFAAGTMLVKGRENTFVLTEQAGVPEIVTFRGQSAAAAVGAESLRVMVVRGASPAADLLFLGGDDKQPWAAFARIAPPVGGMEPMAALTEMARLLETRDYVAFLQTWCLPEDLAKLAKEGPIEKSAAKFGETNAQGLLEVVLLAAKRTPVLSESGEEAIYEGEGIKQRLRLRRVEGRWFLCNH